MHFWIIRKLEIKYKDFNNIDIFIEANIKENKNIESCQKNS